MYNSKLEKEIAGLGNQSMVCLREMWESYFDESAPLFNKPSASAPMFAERLTSARPNHFD